MRGKFISLEGGEGAGKTTNLRLIETYLKNKNIDLIITREPGGTPLAEKIRNLLLEKNINNISNNNPEKFSEETELLLMFAARAQHLSHLILPALDAGKWVICSRFTDSTYAYQGGGRGVSFEKIRILEKLVQGDLQPDISFYFDLPVEIGLARAKARGELDRIEQEQQDFFERVRAVYLDRAKNYSRFHIINANQSIEKVAMDLENILEKFL